MQEADFYSMMEDGQIACQLCAHACRIAEGKTGVCKVRLHRAGKLYSLDYGHLIAEHADPIEKKPLYHFLPGSQAYSIASPGCNFRCAWCQNWDISQACDMASFEEIPLTTPENVVARALASGCESIAYTYTEPTIFYEYCRDVGRIAKANGLKNVFVTNGYMQKDVIDDMSTWLDAANVDIKAFDDAVCKRYMGAHLQPVLDACETLVRAGIWLEVTTLLVPGLNDDQTQLEGLAAFIAGNLGKVTPWHISKYYPNYQYDASAPTSMRSIQNAVAIGRKAGLKFIYVGNAGVDLPTRCPGCGEVLIEREGFRPRVNQVKQGHCPFCGTKIPGIWTGD
jgi:pyruvate formate lyase activating enzyme